MLHLRRNKPICLETPIFEHVTNFQYIGPNKKLQNFYGGGGLAYLWLQYKSWNWLHLILLFHFLLSSPLYSFLIERCNPCCPLSPIWFNATDMINVLLNLLPVSLITVLNKSGLATKFHSSKCHVSLSLFSLCLFRTHGAIPIQVNFARQIWRDQKIQGEALLPVLVLGVIIYSHKQKYVFSCSRIATRGSLYMQSPTLSTLCMPELILAFKNPRSGNGYYHPLYLVVNEPQRD